MKYKINGDAFLNVPPLKVNMGDKVKVTFKNVSRNDSSHPMHLHGHFFQVTLMGKVICCLFLINLAINVDTT